MKQLTKGENTKLEPTVRLVNFTTNSNMAIIARHLSNNGVKVIEQPLDLSLLESEGFTELSLVALSNGLPDVVEVTTDNVPFVSYKPQKNRTEKSVIIAQLYLKSGVWRVKAVDDGFKEGEVALRGHFNLSEPIFKPQFGLTQQFNEFRQSERGRQVEQGVRTATKEATRFAQNVASGASVAYSTVMGNSDAVAQKQAAKEAENFKPLELQKMQSVPFKGAVPAIKNLHIGLGWKSKTGTGFLKGLIGGVKSVNVDLDLSVQLLSFSGEIVDMVYIDKTRSNNLAVNHYGDAATGGNGLQDDEIISVALENLPKEVAFIAITATSNKGHQFAGIESGYLRIVNQEAMLPLVQMALDPVQQKTGCLLGVLSRNYQNEWEFISICDYQNAKIITDLNESILHWCKFIGQARGIVPRDSGSLLPNYNV